MAARLTDQERLERRVTGAQLQRAIVDFAVAVGWTWCHWRALQTRRGTWQTGVEGPLGTGWPDMFLVHPIRHAVLALELKRELGDDPTAAQLWVHEQLRAAGIPTHVVRPSDIREPLEWSVVGRLLLGRPS